MVVWARMIHNNVSLLYCTISISTCHYCVLYFKVHIQTSSINPGKKKDSISKHWRYVVVLQKQIVRKVISFFPVSSLASWPSGGSSPTQGARWVFITVGEGGESVGGHHENQPSPMAPGLVRAKPVMSCTTRRWGLAGVRYGLWGNKNKWRAIGGEGGLWLCHSWGKRVVLLWKDSLPNLACHSCHCWKAATPAYGPTHHAIHSALFLFCSEDKTSSL